MISQNINPGVEIFLETILKLNPLAIGIRGNSQIQQSLVYHLVIILVTFALVEEVDLQG